jgi:glycosyltransferase involved in cell wall biosynthesis
MPDPIRLALVITELAPGGAERCLVNLATGLNRDEFSPVVYSLASRPPAERDQLVQQLAAADVPVHYLDLTRSIQFWSGVSRLAALLREQRAEVVQAFLFHANAMGARAATKAGVPRFYTGIRVADPRRWRTTFERWMVGKATKHICVSQSVADFCRRRGFDPAKLAVVPNGIDVERWKNATPADLSALGLPEGKRAMVYVGRLDRQKGLDNLLAAASDLFWENVDCDLLLVGEGPEQGSLRRAATEAGIEQRVHFAGWQADVPGIVAASELLVLPSRWEGMPNAVLEAMAAGKPVVATRAEGVVELLGDAADEQTAGVGDVQSFYAKARALLENPSRCRELGIRNQQRAAAEFSLQRMLERYAEIYRANEGC